MHQQKNSRIRKVTQTEHCQSPSGLAGYSAFRKSIESSFMPDAGSAMSHVAHGEGAAPRSIVSEMSPHPDRSSEGSPASSIKSLVSVAFWVQPSLRRWGTLVMSMMERPGQGAP